MIIYLTIDSASSIFASKSAKAISGSIIQNSEACLAVLEFSALNVGPNVYIFLNAEQKVSPLNCPLTVKLVSFPKKSLELSTVPSSFLGRLFKSRVVTLNISPAPSQSEPVMIGVCT